MDQTLDFRVNNGASHDASSGEFRIGAFDIGSYASFPLADTIQATGVEFRILGGGVLTSSLVDVIEQLKKRITALEQAIEIVEEPDFEVALEKARRFFDGSRGQKFHPDELADAIGTSVSQAIEICDTLEKEGSIVGK
jgi:hypothetical protein